MMLPRLSCCADLLSEDGSIWVTDDDNEGTTSKVLMDEVFGRGNFVANCLGKDTYARKQNRQGCCMTDLFGLRRMARGKL